MRDSREKRAGMWDHDSLSRPYAYCGCFLLASSPGDPLCAGVPDVLLEKAIINAGATEIDLKVAQNFFMDHVPF